MIVTNNVRRRTVNFTIPLISCPFNGTTRTSCITKDVTKIRSFLRSIISFRHSHLCQGRATSKRISTNASNAISYHHTRYTATIIERRTTNTRHAVRDLHARQTIAIRERIITDRSYTVGDEHTRQAFAITKRTSTDRSYAAGDDHARQVFAITEGRITDRTACNSYFL